MLSSFSISCDIAVFTFNVALLSFKSTFWSKYTPEVP